LVRTGNDVITTGGALRAAGPVAGGGTTNDASAELDVKSTNKGALIPRMTTAQRNAIVAPATGLEVFDTDIGTFYYWTGAAWVPIYTGALNYWQRIGIIVSPLTAGDSVSLGTGILRNTAYASLIDANAKFQPVEILGTNLPANTGLLLGTFRLSGIFGTDAGLSLFSSGNICGLYFSKASATTYYSRIYFDDSAPGIYIDTYGVNTCLFHRQTHELNMYYGITMAASKTVDGLDLNVYGLAYLLNCENCNVTAPGTDPIAADIDKEVNDDGTPVGWLRGYATGAGYWLIELYTPGTIIATGSVLTITAGSAASKTTTGAGTVAPRLSQTAKPHRGKCKIGAGGTVTIYLDDIGTGAGNALYAKEPYIVASYQGNGAAGVLPIDVTVAADRKSAVITGDANKYVVWVSLSEV